MRLRNPVKLFSYKEQGKLFNFIFRGNLVLESIEKKKGQMHRQHLPLLRLMVSSTSLTESSAILQ